MTKFEKILEGLKVFHKYDNDCSTDAQHDVFMVLCNPDEMSDEDKKTVESYGWSIDEYGGWKIFT